MQISTGEEPAICPGCGILAVAREASCASCRAAYRSPPLRAAHQPDGGYWVAVEASFTCRACNFDSPLNHFALGEGVACAHCGIEQRYESHRWQALVDLAHDVGDFGSGGSQGRFVDPRWTVPNPYARLGQRSSWAEASRKAYRASPGNPLCRQCHAPVVVASVEGGVLEAACSECDDRRRYELPRLARTLDGLAGVLADEHERGAREVVVQEQSGVSVLACPSCAAPLEHVGDGDGVVECTYCGATCRISMHARARAGGGQPPVQTWWLYFERPSKQRFSLLREARDAAFDEDMRRRAREEQRAKAEQAAPKKRPAAAPTRAAKVAPPAEPAAAKEKSRRPTIFGILVGGVLPVLLGVIMWWYLESGSLKSDAGLQRFALDMSASQAGALFDVPPANPLKVSFAPWNVIGAAEFACGDSNAYCDVRLRGGFGLDVAAAHGRLEKLAPNRVTSHRYPERGLEYEVELVQSSLDLYTKHGDIRVEDEAKRSDRARERAHALWAAALYVAYGKPELSPAQLALISGPRLSELAALDLGVEREKAAGVFMDAFPDGVCDPRHLLECAISLNDPLVSGAKFNWPNRPTAHIDGVHLDLRRDGVRSTVQACLDHAIGKHGVASAPGKDEVTWELGGAGKVTLYSSWISLRPPYGDDPSPRAAWTKQVAAILNSLSGCSASAK